MQLTAGQSQGNCTGHPAGGNLSPNNDDPTQTDRNHAQTDYKGLQITAV